MGQDCHRLVTHSVFYRYTCLATGHTCPDFHCAERIKLCHNHRPEAQFPAQLPTPLLLLFTMIDVPPAVIGVVYLLPTVLGWPVGTYATLFALQDLFAFTLPTWVIAIACLLAHPVSYTASNYLRERRDERNAAANGAVTAPKVQQGEFTLLKQLMASARVSIPGSVFHGWAKEYGTVYRLRVSGEERVRRFSPSTPSTIDESVSQGLHD